MQYKKQKCYVWPAKWWLFLLSGNRMKCCDSRFYLKKKLQQINIQALTGWLIGQFSLKTGLYLITIIKLIKYRIEIKNQAYLYT